MENKRVIFMGTPDFAVPALQSLIDHPSIDVVAVFTQSPKPKNRGHQVQSTPIHLLADQYEIPVFTPLTLKTEEIQKVIRDLNPELIVVVAYGMLLPKEVLDIPVRGCLNIHASLLPRWRGAAPIQRSIQAGDLETGVCLMKMDVGLDTGGVYATSKMSISKEDTTTTVHDQLSILGGELLNKHVIDLLSGALALVEQQEEGVTYAHKLKKEEGEIHWDTPAFEILNKIRAFNVWPGSFFTLKGDETIKIHKAKSDDKDIPEGLSSGDFFERETGTWFVMCGEGTSIELLRVQKVGGKVLEVKEFLKGTKIF